MNPNDPRHEVVSKQIERVEFGFYNDDDVRERSVVEVTSHQAFDPITHNPLPGGLYDPRMGPLKDFEPPCPTCALRAQNCPGHAGHIELSVAVYHPLLFADLVELLRCKCYSCHRLLLGERQLQVLKAKFLLLYNYDIDRLQRLDGELAVATASVEMKPTRHGAAAVADLARAHDGVLIEIQKQYKEQRKPLNSHERSLYKDLRKELIQGCKGQKRCQHCNAANPKIRQDAHNKIFQASLSRKLQRWNAQENIKFTSALENFGKEQTGYQSDDSRNAGEDDEDGNAMSDDEGSNEESSPTDKYMHAKETLAQVQRTWATNPFLLSCVFGDNGAGEDFEKGYGIFFWQAIPVPPSRFRPAMQLNGMAVEHSQTQYLSQIIRHHDLVRQAFVQRDESRAYAAWIDLQTTVNCFVDSSKDPSATPEHLVAPGIKQILERKEGLFRKNMMGKRVDFACRSVISPDPYIGTNEIGLPRYFATVLTYPVPVTDANVRHLRDLVERGPSNYPGAKWVELQHYRVDLSRMSATKRQAVAAQLLQRKPGQRPVVVGRQLVDGDYVLMNRQPTLHKPGIMAHRVRILHNPTQKTIRMHYANCNTYNADFDGDEMNCHFPQNALAQAEAQYIARTDLQYIVPTDGSPLRGLIQDHVVGGVKLTKRDTFLERWEYQQLLFSSLASLHGLEVTKSSAEIELVPPVILKPRPLWTGKQVITTLLHHLRKGNDRDGSEFMNLPGLSATRKAKTPATAFGKNGAEEMVIIRDGELLQGVLDKAAFGSTAFSLVHAVYEAYGPEKAGLLLNMLGRLFTAYIQFYAGHSCRMEDLVLTKEADNCRKSLVERAYNLGARAAKAWADSEGGKISIPPVNDERPLKPFEAAAASAKIAQLLSGNEGSANFAALDGYMQGQLNPLSSSIVKKSLPSGLAVPFPENTFGLMTTTGAKGSIVNQSQVTCALGQQALEGRRVPRLSSGRTLPSFAPYDPNPRADGFVMDRFLTGIRPQEYYFHCMAGREGLVDTAVKTSRSGYLQRCLMKHLEELKICYDYTVRNSEGTVLQFLYGEDGLDPTKASYLDCTPKSFEFIARNMESLKRLHPSLPYSSIDLASGDSERNRMVSTSGKSNLIVKGSAVLARKLRRGKAWERGMLCSGWFEATIEKVHKNGCVDLRYQDGTKAKMVPVQTELGKCGGVTIIAASNKATLVKPAASDPILATPSRGHLLGTSGSCVSERVAGCAKDSIRTEALEKILTNEEARNEFGSLVGAKYCSSLCDPGEAVGAIAAQSVGEPSTQMTLNTFHLAGSGANVTLGIPRLREIIMTASRNLLTPTMSVPLHSFVSDKRAVRLTREFTKLPLFELISSNKGVAVTERLEQSENGDWCRAYHVSLRLHPAERIKEGFGLDIHQIASVVSKSFVPALARNMKKELARASVEGESGDLEIQGGESTVYTKTEKKNNPKQVDELNPDDNGDDEDDEHGEQDGMDGARESSRRRESISYEDDDDDISDDSAITQSADIELSDPMDTEIVLGDKGGLKVDERNDRLSLAPLRVDPSVRPLLMVDLIEKSAASVLVCFKKDIEEGYINDEEGRGRCLQTAGVNFEEIYKLDVVDHNRLLSNDIWKIRCAYGVEAAHGAIVQQIRGVFGAYGIEVDPRHLLLIADYMTLGGGFKAMNRGGMEASSSPLLQMSFETTAHFLKQAAMVIGSDTMQSPSANIAVGRPTRHGTGSFAVLAS